ncbi:MAG: hypothetical protein KDD70_17865, partial [Bdellovibrionales bacterium]|nr:hypothetical protein [Bdellovibrionales bacterium]
DSIDGIPTTTLDTCSHLRDVDLIIVSSKPYAAQILTFIDAHISKAQNVKLRSGYLLEDYFYLSHQEAASRDFFKIKLESDRPNFRTDFLPYLPENMLSSSEAQMLHWLARHVYQGKGVIVELGSWLGGSTVALASGLSTNSYAKGCPLRTFDIFGGPIESPDCFFTQWVENTSDYQSLISATHQNLNTVKWDGMPIEFLFVDAMKSVKLAESIVPQFYSALIPGESYLIHQDYKFHLTPWILITSFRLREYFEPVLSPSDAYTVVFKNTSAIPRSELLYSVDYSSVTEEEIQASYAYSIPFSPTSGQIRRFFDSYVSKASEFFLDSKS